MKIAALIQAHAHPKRLDQLLDRLSGPLWEPYVHIDQKSNLADFHQSIDKAVFLQNRRPVWWGGFSQVAATLALVEASLCSGCSHFILMSGQCFPVAPDAAFLRHSTIGAGNLFNSVPMPTTSKPMHRITRRHAPDRPRAHAVAYYRLMRLLPERNSDNLLRGIRPHAGSNWWMLERSALEAVYDFHHNNPWLSDVFRTTSCSDEMFFQTILAHLGIQPSGPSPTYAKWDTRPSPNPTPLTQEDWIRLQNSPCLVARKFESYHPYDEYN